MQNHSSGRDVTPSSRDEIVQRMQNAREADTASAARRYGRRWSAETATPRQLERLEAFAAPVWPLRGPFDGRPMAPWGHADHLAAAALGSRVSATTSTRFWSREVRLPDDLLAELDDTDFLEAFLDVALEVWAEVRGEVA